MGRPSKSVKNIKKHLTKAEKIQRETAERELMTGKALKERAEVKENPIAHREFMRINRLLSAIGKNDAMYERIINQYCLLQAECVDLERVKEEFRASREELKEEYEAGKIGENVREGLTPSAYYKLISTMQGNIIALDRQVHQKQKMMLDIEKECAMTISAAMRSIPKETGKKENPLLAVLKDEDE